jgi:hypothetical protein
VKGDSDVEEEDVEEDDEEDSAEIAFLEHKLDDDIPPMWASSSFCAGMMMLSSFLFLSGRG